MHELSIALSIIALAAEESERRGGVPIGAIHVRIGVLSGVASEALLSAYELAREGSAFAGTTLVVHDEPIIIYCARCEAECSIDSVQSLNCMSCGEPPTEVR